MDGLTAGDMIDSTNIISINSNILLGGEFKLILTTSTCKIRITSSYIL